MTTIVTTRTRSTETTRPPRGRRRAGARSRVELGHQLVDLLTDCPKLTVNFADELGIGQHHRNTLRVVLDRMAGRGLVVKQTGFGTVGSCWLLAGDVSRHEAHERWAAAYERVTRPSSRAGRCGGTRPRVRAQRWADFL
jgi:hypothetical protein